MNIKKLTFFTFLSFLLISSTGCNKKADEITDNIVAKPSIKTTQTQTTQAQNQHTLTLTTIDGKNMKAIFKDNRLYFEQYKNKTTLIVFFATWCPPCKAEIPHLINLQNKYKDKLQVIGVSVDQDVDNKFMLDFAQRYGINYPITFGRINFDFANALGGASSIPALFLFNQKGQLYQKYVGAVQEEILNSDILESMQ